MISIIKYRDPKYKHLIFGLDVKVTDEEMVELIMDAINNGSQRTFQFSNNFNEKAPDFSGTKKEKDNG